MTTLEQVREAAMQLSEAERQALAQDLMDSVQKEPGYDEAWAEEIARRIEEMDSGKTQPVPWEEVRRQLFNGLNGGAGSQLGARCTVRTPGGEEYIRLGNEQRALAFAGAMDRTLAIALRFPDSGRAQGETRVLRVRGFPYLLVYVLRHGEIRVVAIAHTSRRPGYWRDCLD